MWLRLKGRRGLSLGAQTAFTPRQFVCNLCRSAPCSHPPSCTPPSQEHPEHNARAAAHHLRGKSAPDLTLAVCPLPALRYNKPLPNKPCHSVDMAGSSPWLCTRWRCAHTPGAARWRGSGRRGPAGRGGQIRRDGWEGVLGASRRSTAAALADEAAGTAVQPPVLHTYPRNSRCRSHG